MTTASITVSPAASTSYTVTGFSGACSASGIGTVTLNSPPVLSVNDFTGCPGQPAVLSASGAAGYVWSNGATSASVSVQPLTTTTYTVTGTGATGCTATATATAFVLPPPAVTVTDDTICSGQVAVLTASGASTYLWSNGATSAMISVSPTSNASFSVIGTSGGCADTATATVTVSAPPVVSVNSTSVCSGQSVTLTATGAVVYTWSNGATGSTLTVSPTQTTSYSVTATASGCTSTSIATVTVIASPTLTVSQPVVCAGQSATLSASGASSYSWNTGATGASVTVTPSATTVYTVTGTSGGCSSTAYPTVTVNPLPVLQVNSPVICPGSTAVISVSGATSYQWSNGFTGNTITVTPAVTSGYTVTGTTAGCSTYAVATVTVSNVLSVDAGDRDTVCYGSSIQLSASPALPGCTYSWSPSSGLSSVSVSNPIAAPLATTVYVVTVVDANGCSGTDWIIVEVDSGFSVSATAVNERCTGNSDGQISLTQALGVPPFSYAWSNGATSASVSGLAAGSYSVTVTDLAGCTATASATISSPAVLSASPGTLTDVTCNGSCDGSVTISAVGGTGTYSYSWPSFPAQSGSSISGICEGVYQCVVSDANGCTASLSFTIAAPPPFLLDSIVSTTPCNGGSTNLQVIAGNIAGAQFIWTPATGLSDSSVSNPVASPSAATTYTVTVVDTNGCQSAPVTVNVPGVSSAPIVTTVTGDSVICAGESVTLSATALAGNGGPYTFSWTPSLGLSDPTVPDPVSTPDSTVTYTVTVSDGCTAPQSVSFTVSVLSMPVPAFSVGNYSGCIPLCVSFSTAANAGISYSWDFGDGSASTNGPQPSHCYASPGTYDVGLTVSNPQGCSSDTSLPGLITVSSPPIADFSVSSNEVTDVSPSIDFTDRSSGNPIQWQWDFGDGSFSADRNPSHVFFSDTAGVYEVQLIVANSSGCTDTFSLSVEVSAEMSFYAPNCFTPNGDGANEVFAGYGRGIKEYHLMIFDRWGDLIWQTHDIREGWNGIANDGVLISQQDAFDWKVILTDIYDRQRIYLGRVSIVK
jgi:gliding motility-associated-like protein